MTLIPTHEGASLAGRASELVTSVVQRVDINLAKKNEQMRMLDVEGRKLLESAGIEGRTADTLGSLPLQRFLQK